MRICHDIDNINITILIKTITDYLMFFTCDIFISLYRFCHSLITYDSLTLTMTVTLPYISIIIYTLQL